MTAAYARWGEMLVRNRNERRPVRLDGPVGLTPQERARIAASLREFQLGETGQGSHLFACAARWVETTGAEDYVPTLRLLFQDEATHAQELGRYMDLAGIPRESRTTLNDCFRRIRKLAGIEVMIATLLVGELVGMVYYRALRDATRCGVLRALCRSMLADEAMHVGFQATLLAEVDRRRSALVNLCASAWRAALLLAAGTLVWIRHRRFFVAAGYGYGRFVAVLRAILRKAESLARWQQHMDTGDISP